MKNLMVANLRERGRYSFENVDRLLKAQIENSVEVGWEEEDIILVANFDYEYMGVKTQKTDLNKHCFTGSKMFAVKWVFENLNIDDIVWARDLDIWQNISFDPPEFKDVGLTTYSSSRLNGGCVFWKPSAKDMIDHIVLEINNGSNKEEPVINKLFNTPEYKPRVTVLNNTYNVGCSGYYPRYLWAEKPIRAAHMNPTNRIAWETHRLNRDGMGAISISPRLENILRKYYPLATEISSEGKERSEVKKQQHEGRAVKYQRGNKNVG